MSGRVLWGYVFFVLTAFAYGSFEVASKIALKGSGVDPLHVNLVKFGIGMLTLLPFMLPRIRGVKLRPIDHIHFLGLGVLDAVSMLALVASIPALGSAALAGLIFSSNPVFTVVFGRLIAKEKGGRYLWPAVVLGLVGMFTISAHKVLGVRHIDWWGLFLVFFAAITFSLYSVLTKVKNQQVDKHVTIFFTFLWALVTFVAILLVKGEPIVVPAFYSSIRVALALLWIGVVVTGLGYIFYFKGMELAGVHRSTTVFFLKPAVAGTLAWLVLGETITWNMILGTVLVLISMWLMSKD